MMEMESGEMMTERGRGGQEERRDGARERERRVETEVETKNKEKSE